jgi:hypothetical protein
MTPETDLYATDDASIAEPSTTPIVLNVPATYRTQPTSGDVIRSYVTTLPASERTRALDTYRKFRALNIDRLAHVGEREFDRVMLCRNASECTTSCSKAHSPSEQRPMLRNPTFKSMACRDGDNCRIMPYCQFRHHASDRSMDPWVSVTPFVDTRTGRRPRS